MYESCLLSEIIFRHSYCRSWGKPCCSVGWNLSLCSQIRSFYAFDSWLADGSDDSALSSFGLTHYRFFKVCCWCGVPRGCIVCELLSQSDLNIIQSMSNIHRNTQTYFVLFILLAADERLCLAVFSWQWRHFPNYFVSSLLLTFCFGPVLLLLFVFYIIAFSH